MVRGAAAAVAVSAVLAAGSVAAERHPQHRLTASSHDRTVEATLGSHCTPTGGSVLCADSTYPLPTEKRLPVHGGGRIVLELGADPEEVHASLRDRRSRTVRELRARGTGRKRKLRLPRQLSRDSDRLGVFVTYERGSADFEVDLKRHRHR